jgi:hypothetical protein
MEFARLIVSSQQVTEVCIYMASTFVGEIITEKRLREIFWTASTMQPVPISRFLFLQAQKLPQFLQLGKKLLYV